MKSWNSEISHSAIIPTFLFQVKRSAFNIIISTESFSRPQKNFMKLVFANNGDSLNCNYDILNPLSKNIPRLVISQNCQRSYNLGLPFSTQVSFCLIIFYPSLIVLRTMLLLSTQNNFFSLKMVHLFSCKQENKKIQLFVFLSFFSINDQVPGRFIGKFVKFTWDPEKFAIASAAICIRKNITGRFFSVIWKQAWLARQKWEKQADTKSRKMDRVRRPKISISIFNLQNSKINVDILYSIL